MYSNTDFSLSSLYDNFVPDYDIDCINSFKSKLFILPYGNSEICYSIYKDIKYQFGSDIIIFFPTNNYIKNTLITFNLADLAIINENITIDFNLLTEIQSKYTTTKAELSFEYSEMLSGFLEYLKKENFHGKILPLFYNNLKSETVTDLLKNYYGIKTIIFFSLLSRGLSQSEAEITDKLTAYNIEESKITDINYQKFSAYKILPTLLSFIKDNKYSLIRTHFVQTNKNFGTSKLSYNYAAWLLYENTKIDFIEKYYSNTIIEYANFLLRRELHLICGETFKLPEVFDEKFYICFSLEMNGQIRGVSKTKKIYEPLSKSIERNIFGAAFSDDRFPPLQQKDLSCLKINYTLFSEQYNDKE